MPFSLRSVTGGKRRAVFVTVKPSPARLSPASAQSLTANLCPQAPTLGFPGQMVTSEQLAPSVPPVRAGPEHRCIYQPLKHIGVAVTRFGGPKCLIHNENKTRMFARIPRFILETTAIASPRQGGGVPPGPPLSLGTGARLLPAGGSLPTRTCRGYGLAGPKEEDLRTPTTSAGLAGQQGRDAEASSAFVLGARRTGPFLGRRRPRHGPRSPQLAQKNRAPSLAAGCTGGGLFPKGICTLGGVIQASPP